MKQYKYSENGIVFVRVHKSTARNAYILGYDVIMCPVNIRPGTPWHPDILVNRKYRESFVIDEIGTENDFNNIVRSFEYYNCINAETGKYAAFYIKEDDIPCL